MHGMCDDEKNHRHYGIEGTFGSRRRDWRTILGTFNVNFSTEAHVPTPRYGPYACAQPYHPGSGSHVQLLRPYWGSSAWNSLRVCERANPCIKDPLLPRRVQKSTPLRGVRTGEPVYQRPITAQASAKKYSFKRSTNGRTRVCKTHYYPGECKKVLL